LVMRLRRRCSRVQAGLETAGGDGVGPVANLKVKPVAPACGRGCCREAPVVARGRHSLPAPQGHAAGRQAVRLAHPEPSTVVETVSAAPNSFENFMQKFRLINIGISIKKLTR
jgi:hypothetical protein